MRLQSLSDINRPKTDIVLTFLIKRFKRKFTVPRADVLFYARIFLTVARHTLKMNIKSVRLVAHAL